MKIALCVINPTIADLTGNRALIERAISEARDAGADLAVLPELCLCGYPPRDLLTRPGFAEACWAAALEIGRHATAGLAALIGAPRPTGGGRGVANSIACFRDGELAAIYDKRLLPTYDVFDEDRYFAPGAEPVVVEIAGRRVGMALCEDLWQGDDAGRHARYAGDADPVGALAAAGTEIVAVPSASPFVMGKQASHIDVLRRHATRRGLTLVSVNQLGGNDDLIFDGHACVVAPDGRIVGATAGFEPAVLTIDHAADDAVDDPLLAAGPEAALYKALRLGVADYVRKTGFRRVAVGLSGGIDSALTATIGAAALGPGRVLGALMPSGISSDHSREDAAELGRRLGLRTLTMPITAPLAGFTAVIDRAFDELDQPRLGAVSPDVTDENLQSRVRGTLMMALSNRTGALVLTTGNKSELAVGYCTLYGDMNGGLAVLSDVPKTWVYRLSRWINEHHNACGFDTPPIPDRSIEKPPSAELAPDQLDADSLPPYEVLDEIIERSVELGQDEPTIAAETGIDPAEIGRICRLIRLNEYKRRQAAIGLKVRRVAFGPGRRMPVARG